MDTTLFSKYTAAIRSSGTDVLDHRLLMQSDGKVSVYYAPFDIVNLGARIAIVGITPGKTQMRNALAEARHQISAGARPEAALASAKATAAFSGDMRSALVALMDHVGLNNRLKLRSCEELFTTARSLLQTCSVLPFPTFAGTEDYNGTPSPLTHPLLREQVSRHFEPVLKALAHAYFVPLGRVPTKVMLELSKRGLIVRDRILDGLPHPSGANRERISYFLGRKPRELLSAKTDPGKIDAAKASLKQRIQLMAA